MSRSAIRVFWFVIGAVTCYGSTAFSTSSFASALSFPSFATLLLAFVLQATVAIGDAGLLEAFCKCCGNRNIIACYTQKQYTASNVCEVTFLLHASKKKYLEMSLYLKAPDTWCL